MKTSILFTVFLVAIFSSLTAQIEKGRLLVGGNVGISSVLVENSDFNTTSFGINPNVGVFVSDGLAVGGGISLGAVWSQREPFFSIGLSPFIRYYLPSFFFGEASFTYRTTISDFNDQNSFNISPAIGYAIFINDFIAIEPAVVADFLLESDENSLNATIISGRVGFQIYLDKLGRE